MLALTTIRFKLHWCVWSELRSSDATLIYASGSKPKVLCDSAQAAEILTLWLEAQEVACLNLMSVILESDSTDFISSMQFPDKDKFTTYCNIIADILDRSPIFSGCDLLACPQISQLGSPCYYPKP
uniref:Uncharacterized protein n=1 Tax=Nelumbo nucifera TaxID=4432 RepID=A0A822YZ63_NELNU|nr:TPA_asm: hypothetical protein HUJ06_007402 [Nelumbo nucifera]